MEKTLVLKPRMSEKTYRLSEQRTYVVDVPASASKDLIAKAMVAQFGITVETVNVINVKGKTKRTVRKGGRPIMGKRSGFKKAYVTLKEGDKLPFFAEIEEAEAKEKKSEKKNARAEKETK